MAAGSSGSGHASCGVRNIIKQLTRARSHQEELEDQRFLEPSLSLDIRLQSSRCLLQVLTSKALLIRHNRCRYKQPPTASMHIDSERREWTTQSQGLRAGWSKSPVCVFKCYPTRLGKGQISHPGTAVFVCILLAWWMDQKWSTLFRDRFGSI